MIAETVAIQPRRRMAAITKRSSAVLTLGNAGRQRNQNLDMTGFGLTDSVSSKCISKTLLPS